MTTATDPDAPRRWGMEQPSEAALIPVAPRLAAALTDDEDDASEVPDYYDLPEDLSGGEDLLVKLVPKRADEFTCSACFLVQHRSRRSRSDPAVCIDCN